MRLSVSIILILATASLCRSQFLKSISPISDTSETLTMLLVSHNVLQVGDIGLTLYAVNHGAHETNPIFGREVGLGAIVKIGYGMGTNALIKEIYKQDRDAAYSLAIFLNVLGSVCVEHNVSVVMTL